MKKTNKISFSDTVDLEIINDYKEKLRLKLTKELEEIENKLSGSFSMVHRTSFTINENDPSHEQLIGMKKILVKLIEEL